MDMKPTMGLETAIKPCYKGSHEKGWTRLFKMQHIGPASAAALSPRVAIRASSTRDFPTQKLFTKVGVHPLTNVSLFLMTSLLTGRTVPVLQVRNHVKTFLLTLNPLNTVYAFPRGIFSGITKWHHFGQKKQYENIIKTINIL